MKRVAIYVRVSTAEQKEHGLSVDSQITALTEYAQANNYIIAGVYNDAGISARKSYRNRPALLKLVKDCQDGKIDLILITKLDRFFRSVKDYYSVMSQIGEVPWRAIWEDYETETSTGVFKVNIMLSVAQAESDRTSERIKAINEYRRAKGCYVGTAPLGYVSSHSHLIKDEHTREAVEAFFIEFNSTRNMRAAIRAADVYGVKISRERARGMLSNETYSGIALTSECEPYITPEEYRANKSVLENRRWRKAKYNIYLFSGLVRCKYCGGRMNAGYKLARVSGKDYRYKVYQCRNAHDMFTCDNTYTVHENVLEKWLVNKLDAELKEIGYNTLDKISVSNKKKTDVKTERDKLTAKLKRVGERYEDGDITREEYRAKRDSIKQELDKLVEPVTSPINLPSNWLDIYKELDEQSKKDFWAGTITQITVGKRGEYDYF